MIGKSISHYRIIDKLGQGGMGEVFLAQDTSLDRNVALKFLPDVFSCDPERLVRFEREAKLLASLNHPNIAAFYGFEESGGKRFLVRGVSRGTDYSAPELASVDPVTTIGARESTSLSPEFP